MEYNFVCPVGRQKMVFASARLHYKHLKILNLALTGADMQPVRTSEEYRRSISVCLGCMDILRLEILSNVVAVLVFLPFSLCLFSHG